MIHQIRFTCSAVLLIVAMLCLSAGATAQIALAQSAPTTPAPAPGVPILPAKPTATPTAAPTATPTRAPIRFLIQSHYTAPQQPRGQEPFDLHLEIKNIGADTANGYTIRSVGCAGDILVEGACSKPIPTAAAGQSVWVVFRLRLVGALDQGDVKGLNLQIADDHGADLADQLGNMTVNIHFLPARAIEDETPTLKRPFPGPNITIGKTWTARARSTEAELLTPVPVRLGNAAPGGGGYEFELVIELHNQGPVEATNIFVDFCDGSDNPFNPVGSTCRKFVPANLPPGAKAIASQTLAFKNTATPAPRGTEVQLKVSYEFWYVEQWLKGEATPTVAIYPQEYPALALAPYAAPQLTVNTEQLNVRLGPGVAYPGLGLVRAADSFAITGRTPDADWWQINYNGQAGWVSAAYVIVRGGEYVAEVATPPAPPAPGSAAVGQQEPAAAAANALSTATPAPPIVPPVARANVRVELPAPATEPARPGNGLMSVAVGPGAAEPNAAEPAGPWLVIERYRTVPQPIADGRPFTLELTLRNPGRQTAGQLALVWRSNQIAALGTGGVLWLGDLLPGMATTVSGQFLVTDPRPLGVLRLPIELLYSDEAGQTHVYRDEIALLRQTPQPTVGPTAGAAATSPQRSRPLWLSALLGFLGLGGGQR